MVEFLYRPHRDAFALLRITMGGPCPATANTAHYCFKLFTLDTELKLKARATKVDLERALAGQIIAQSDTIGIYSRASRALPK